MEPTCRATACQPAKWLGFGRTVRVAYRLKRNLCRVWTKTWQPCRSKRLAMLWLAQASHPTKSVLCGLVPNRIPTPSSLPPQSLPNRSALCQTCKPLIGSLPAKLAPRRWWRRSVLSVRAWRITPWRSVWTLPRASLAMRWNTRLGRVGRLSCSVRRRILWR